MNTEETRWRQSWGQKKSFIGLTLWPEGEDGGWQGEEDASYMWSLWMHSKLLSCKPKSELYIHSCFFIYLKHFKINDKR
jgi:hypothetical protein